MHDSGQTDLVGLGRRREAREQQGRVTSVQDADGWARGRRRINRYSARWTR
jgi:hypothetical protein